MSQKSQQHSIGITKLKSERMPCIRLPWGTQQRLYKLRSRNAELHRPCSLALCPLASCMDLDTCTQLRLRDSQTVHELGVQSKDSGARISDFHSSRFERLCSFPSVQDYARQEQYPAHHTINCHSSHATVYLLPNAKLLPMLHIILVDVRPLQC